MPTDKWGNKLTVDDFGIHLDIRGAKYRRKIFAFRSGGVVKHIKKNHIMNHLMSGKMIGFNYEALKLLSNMRVKVIWVLNYPEKIKGKVTIKELLETGEFLHFKQTGFERQIFYPLKKIKGLDKWI